MREMLAEWGYNPEDYASDDDEEDKEVDEQEQLDEVAGAPKPGQQAEAAQQLQQQAPDRARQGTPAGPSKEVQRRCLCIPFSAALLAHSAVTMPAFTLLHLG